MVNNASVENRNDTVVSFRLVRFLRRDEISVVSD
jgi:hypothetical protein